MCGCKGSSPTQPQNTPPQVAQETPSQSAPYPRSYGGLSPAVVSTVVADRSAEIYRRLIGLGWIT